MSNKHALQPTFKNFNFAVFLSKLGPKMNAVVNANCDLEYQDTSKTYKTILNDIGIESTSYSSFRKALNSFFAEREELNKINNNQQQPQKINIPKPKKSIVQAQFFWPFVFKYGFFPGLSYIQFTTLIKHIYISALAHGCRFTPTDTNADLKIDEVQFESFSDYTYYVDLIDYQYIEPVVTSKFWYKFLECKYSFDYSFLKNTELIDQFVIHDPLILEGRKEMIMEALNQNGEVNITPSYIQASIESLAYPGNSLFKLSILQTLSLGSLKYDPYGTELVGNADSIKQFKALAKKKTPFQTIKKLTELAVILGYNAVVYEPCEKDILELIGYIQAFIKNYNEVRHFLEQTISIILEIGIKNTTIQINKLEFKDAVNPESLVAK